MINVTKAYLPPLEKYIKYLEKIWDSAWLTNNGPLLQELEEKLKQYLGVKHCFFCSNGTIAIQIAIKACNLNGEIITTPYSYVATLNSIIWESCKPVFADINNIDFTINADLVEAAITAETQAILAVHVYGNPANVSAIESISREHNLKVIYDAAHAFGAQYMDRSVLTYGDIATCSLHATKLFHSAEGGLIVTDNDELARNVYLMRQFGHVGDDYFGLGVNGKNSEFHAAMGLCIFDELDEIIRKRKELVELYEKYLTPGKLQVPVALEGTKPNYAYYPVVFESEAKLLEIKDALSRNKINTRRYFFPSLNTLPHVTYQACPVSESVALRVLALPLYPGLMENEVKSIADIINALLCEMRLPNR
ncbi:MAG: DegT/DnrJ/EryC1/StrS family aminotransferase [Ferruginibacter sp.]